MTFPGTVMIYVIVYGSSSPNPDGREFRILKKSKVQNNYIHFQSELN